MSTTRTNTDVLRKNPMMRHLLEALEDGEDVGHYGRLTFAMVARHFLDDETLVETLANDHDFDRDEALALVHQVKTADYSPPGPAKIRKWEQEQDFPIIPPDGDAVDDANVYQDLNFPDDVYEKIEAYHREKAEHDLNVAAS